MSTRVSILLVIVCIAFGCSKSQQTVTEQATTNNSPWIQPPDARLTIAKVSQMATKAALASGYHLDDYTQCPPHFVRISKTKFGPARLSWQVDFPRKNPMPGGRYNPTNYFMVFIGDESGKISVDSLMLK